jgi:Fe-Mn family superoxide dismutase
MYNFIKYVVEGKEIKPLEQVALSYARDALEPCLSEQTINYHYGKLYKTYVDRYNNKEGDPDFNEAGAYLHSIYFPQLQIPREPNDPVGKSKEFIENHFKTFDKFKEEFVKVAMGIQGSGWAYLAKNGEIKTIVNHQIKNDIILLIDWWEHAWALDYQADKKGYLANHWKIINWNLINERL